MTLFLIYLGWWQRTLPQPKRVGSSPGRGEPPKIHRPSPIKRRAHSPMRMHESPRFALQPPLVPYMRHSASQNHRLHACTPGPLGPLGPPFRLMYIRVNASIKPTFALQIAAIDALKPAHFQAVLTAGRIQPDFCRVHRCTSGRNASWARPSSRCTWAYMQP
jgi:hypothetical protein